MKKNLLLFAVAAFGLLTPLSASADETAAAPAAEPAAAPAEQATTSTLSPAEQKAVDAYRLRLVRATFESMADLMDGQSNNGDMFTTMRSLLDACKNTPVDGLPAEFKEFMEENIARSEAMLESADPDKLDPNTEEGRKALVDMQEQGEKNVQELEAKYPNASAVLGSEAMSRFSMELMVNMDAEGKAQALVEKDPSLMADQNKLMAEVFRMIIKEIDAKIAE